MRRTIGCTLMLLVTGAVAAQEAVAPPDPRNPVDENLTTPSDWRVRLDAPDPEVVVGDDQETADIWFVNMTPGWHVTTGPRAIFWHPGLAAEGAWRVEATIHLFDPGERNEAFGIFFGGGTSRATGSPTTTSSCATAAST